MSELGRNDFVQNPLGRGLGHDDGQPVKRPYQKGEMDTLNALNASLSRLRMQRVHAGIINTFVTPPSENNSTARWDFEVITHHLVDKATAKKMVDEAVHSLDSPTRVRHWRVTRELSIAYGLL